MDEFKPRSIEVIIVQAHMFGIEGEELREFVLNQQKLDLERLKLELERKAIEMVKLKMELEVKLSFQGDVPYKIEIENDLSTNEEQNNCRDIINNISGIEDNEEIENVLSSKELNDCNYTVYDINEIDIGVEMEHIITTKELIDKECIDCQFIDNTIIHVLRPFHIHKPLKRLKLTKGVYQVVGGGKVKPDPNRLQMFLYLKLPRKIKKKS
ncbi:reticulocyte-binding protein PFD0110w-like isoform X1 [Biomphalaria pfeifferi]|uniref:Reticulocyte-binding protein PFD0110w-like isoform X1 n=1 Tax=Biomphalaria pfeifferi TaxID=112525 RepID=A0AAD8C6W9_BIOPF|nr:reticulocyte-binding protein PFD0110w-like isoform X1 [Biomphalaria pfeifferi]